MKTGVIDFGISDEVLLWKTYRKVRPDFIDLEDSHTWSSHAAAPCRRHRTSIWVVVDAKEHVLYSWKLSSNISVLIRAFLQTNRGHACASLELRWAKCYDDGYINSGIAWQEY